MRLSAIQEERLSRISPSSEGPEALYPETTNLPVSSERYGPVIREVSPGMKEIEERKTSVRRRRIFLVVGIAVAVAALTGGWLYARHVYTTDFSAVGRMEQRGFGKRLDSTSAAEGSLWHKVRDEERRYASDGRHDLFDASRLLRAYKAFLESDEHFPDHMRAYVLNNSAWFLATTDNVLLYDPERSLELAEQAVLITRRGQPMYLDTLAEALHRNGLHDKALDTEYEALELAPEATYIAPQIQKFQEAAESKR